MSHKIPLILLSGLLCDEALWQHQLKALKDMADCRVADTTRHDRIEALARDVLAQAPAQFALAGLSMGGAQTINIAFAKPKVFSYVGVYSSGIFLTKTADWEKDHKDGLDDTKGLKLLWFATGSQDFLLNRTKETVELFKKHEFNPVFKETTGGHTWINWQKYLNEFAPQLFQ